MFSTLVTLNSGICVPPSELCMRNIPECQLQRDSYQIFMNQMLQNLLCNDTYLVASDVTHWCIFKITDLNRQNPG